MRIHLLRALPLALIACAAAWLAIVGGPEPARTPVEELPTVGQIDLDALHRDASSALDALRHSQKHKLAAVAEAS
jgi:hypothetical protein